MNRFCAIVLLAAGACSPGTLSSPMEGADAGDDAAAAARAAYDETVKPILDLACVQCHANGAGGATMFLEPNPDDYTTVTTWPGLIDYDTPQNSRLLNKGAHMGRALSAEEVTTMNAWIQLEAEVRVEEAPVVETATFTPLPGVNTVPLDDLGLAGSSITFRYERVSTGFYVSELAANAGADGLHLVHPLFVTWVDGAPLPDTVDRFASVDLAVPPNESRPIGGGTAVITDVPPDIELSIHFRTATTADGGGNDGDGGIEGGCKDVASFTANAQPRLSASCVSCHGGGNGQATSAVDMTQVNDTSPEAQAAACGQILSRVNVLDANNSGIFLAPDPDSGTGHPFKFPAAGDFTAFRDDLLLWIANEQ